MEPKDYEIRVHIEDITEHVNWDSTFGKMCGSKVWNVWAYMPAFGNVYCSAQSLTFSLHVGVVALSQIESPDLPESWDDDRCQAWFEKLDELCREEGPENDIEAFNPEVALKNSFDDTLDYKGERWADYDDLEEAMAELDAAYASGGGRSDTHGERAKVFKAVENILKAVRENYACNGGPESAVQKFFDLRREAMRAPENETITVSGVKFSQHSVRYNNEQWTGPKRLKLIHRFFYRDYWTVEVLEAAPGVSITGPEAPTPEEALAKFAEDPKAQELGLTIEQLKEN